MSTTQHEALAALIERFRGLHIDHEPDGWPAVRTREITALLDRIADLEARVQELGQMARDVNSRRVVELESQLAERTAQESAIGAGGVSALMGAANAGSEPVAWPKNAAEVREFMGTNCEAMEFGNADQSPSEDDRYKLTAHDFLSAVNWWADFATHPSPPEGMAGWTKLPGTLPKPGTPVLLDIGKKYPIRAMWAAKHTVQAADDDTDWGEYDEATDEYWCPEGWYEWNQNEDNHWCVTETPRAWMHLPPTSAEGVEHG